MPPQIIFIPSFARRYRNAGSVRRPDSHRKNRGDWLQGTEYTGGAPKAADENSAE
jgi:hypothetical protein